MVTPKIEVEPRGGQAQAVIHRGHLIAGQAILITIVFKPGVGSHIDAGFLVGEDLTPTLETSAAGSIALALGTLTGGAKIRHIGKSTIAAVHAFV